MNLPPCNAEDSLYPSTGAYYAVAGRGAAPAGVLTPALDTVTRCRSVWPAWGGLANVNALCGDCAQFTLTYVCRGTRNCGWEWTQVTDWGPECWEVESAW